MFFDVMKKAKWSRGQRIDRPVDLTITSTRLTPDKTLYFDHDHGYLMQTTRSDDPTPTAYYKIEYQKSGAWIKSYKIGLLGVLAASLFLVLYPLYPAAQYQLDRAISTAVNHTQALAQTPSQVSNTNRLIIPKIGVSANILEGPNLTVLDHQDGVWHQTGTLQSGNFVLAGHRWKYLPPNSTTFYSLNQLSVNDTIIIDWYRTRYIYQVDKIETVNASDVAVLAQTTTPKLTIYTCNDISETKRTVVTAHMIP